MSDNIEYQEYTPEYEEYFEEEPAAPKNTFKVFLGTLGILALTAGAAFIGYGEAQAQEIVDSQASETISTFDNHYSENILKTNAYKKVAIAGTETNELQPLLDWNLNTSNVYLSPTGLISKIQKNKLEASSVYKIDMANAAEFKKELDNFCLVAKTIEGDKNPTRSYTIVENTLEKLVDKNGKKDDEAWVNSSVRLGLPANFFSTKTFIGKMADESNASNYVQYCYVKRENQSKMEEFLVSAIHVSESNKKVEK